LLKLTSWVDEYRHHWEVAAKEEMVQSFFAKFTEYRKMEGYAQANLQILRAARRRGDTKSGSSLLGGLSSHSPRAIGRNIGRTLSPPPINTRRTALVSHKTPPKQPQPSRWYAGSPLQ